jgi:hypothetical protein
LEKSALKAAISKPYRPLSCLKVGVSALYPPTLAEPKSSGLTVPNWRSAAKAGPAATFESDPFPQETLDFGE